MPLGASIIGLDIGRRTGVCHGPAGEKPECFTWTLSPAHGRIGESMCGLYDRLLELARETGAQGILFEAPLPPSKGRGELDTRYLYGLSAQVYAVAHRLGLPECREENQSKIRKYVAGHGNAKKEDVAFYARMEGIEGVDLNATDAWGVWKYACALYAPKTAAEKIFAAWER